MPLQKKYESDFYRIEVDGSRSLLQTVWLRQVNEQEMKTGGLALYQALQDTQAERVIANAQQMASLSAETKEWMSSTFYHLLSQTQLRRLARVLPCNLFHQLALESVVTRAEALGKITYDVRNFARQEEAMDWLFR